MGRPEDLCERLHQRGIADIDAFISDRQSEELRPGSQDELGYDDYKDFDVEGKIVAYLSKAAGTFPAELRAHFSSAGPSRIIIIATKLKTPRG